MCGSCNWDSNTFFQTVEPHRRLSVDTYLDKQSKASRKQSAGDLSLPYEWKQNKLKKHKYLMCYIKYQKTLK